MGLRFVSRPYTLGCFLGLFLCLILGFWKPEMRTVSSGGLTFSQVRMDQQGQDWSMVAERAVQGDKGDMILTGKPMLKFKNIQCQSEKIIQSPEQLTLFELQLQDLNIQLDEMQLSTSSQSTQIDELALLLDWPLTQHVEGLVAKKWVGPQSDLNTLMERHQKLFDHRPLKGVKAGSESVEIASETIDDVVMPETFQVNLKADHTQLLIARLRIRAKMRDFALIHPNWHLMAKQGHWTSPQPVIKLYGHIELSSDNKTQEGSSGEIHLDTGRLFLFSPDREFALGDRGFTLLTTESKP